MRKKIVSIIYIILLIITNIFLVPFNKVFLNPQGKDGIKAIVYDGIWKTLDNNIIINDAPLRYELNMPRVLHMFILLSIIFYTIYKVIDSKNQ